ncbi:fatty acid desaturase CarF family protein, partial [Acinetobacter baumannii]
LSLALNLAVTLLPVPGWISAGVVAAIGGGAFAQYFHGTLHRDDNPWFVTAMRRMGLLMTPEAHQLHHDTLKRDFATNSGWSNPL